MIVREDYPSYGYIVKQGFNTMVEEFREDFTDFGTSYNHHFLCDLTGWFIKSVLGIRVNPCLRSCNELNIAPEFIETLDWAEGHHNIPLGRVGVKWKREGEKVLLNVSVPEGAFGQIMLPGGYVFADGMSEKKLANVDEIEIVRRA
jgi:alpha-L-rhamnosidase